MRIAGGEFRGRNLRTPKGEATRPTSGMVRETLFNILAPVLPDARFLDLFAGSGAVGLEAISRGAATATFVESARPALDCLRANIATLEVAAQTTVLAIPVARALEHLAKQGAQFDVIFLDPPFRDLPAYLSVLDHVAALLAPAGQLIAQHAPRVTLPEAAGTLTLRRRHPIGDNVLSFYARAHSG